MTASADLVIAGHATIDDIHHADGREQPGTFGGGAIYASVGAALVGAHSTLVSLVGDDYPVSRLRDALGPSVDLSAVRTLPGRSVHNNAWYGAAGERRWEIESWQRMEELTPAGRDLARVVPHSFVLVTQSSLWQQRELIKAAGAANARIAVDTELHYIETTADCSELLSLVRRVDVFLPSIEHLHGLFGGDETDAVAYAPHLHRLGCSLVAVKHGASGSTVFDFAAGNVWKTPAASCVAVVDTTGAGDAFNGGFIATLAEGLAVPDAAAWGTVAASFVVETIGARIPSRFDRVLAERRFTSVRAQTRQMPLPATNAEKEFAT